MRAVEPVFAREIAAWFKTLAGCVDRVDYRAAQALFDEDIVNFSTVTTMLRGKDAFREGQWRKVWPTIEDFRFVLERLECGCSADGTMAWGAVPWTSTGIAADGGRFDRPGRASAIFTRPEPAAPWLAVHIHFSLYPGTPEKSFGRKPERI